VKTVVLDPGSEGGFPELKEGPSSRSMKEALAQQLNEVVALQLQESDDAAEADTAVKTDTAATPEGGSQDQEAANCLTDHEGASSPSVSNACQGSPG
jgi:hypothetical protein